MILNNKLLIKKKNKSNELSNEKVENMSNHYTTKIIHLVKLANSFKRVSHALFWTMVDHNERYIMQALQNAVAINYR